MLRKEIMEEQFFGHIVFLLGILLISATFFATNRHLKRKRFAQKVIIPNSVSPSTTTKNK